MQETATSKIRVGREPPLNGSKRIRPPSKKQQDPLSVEPVVAAIRSLWKAIESSNSPNQNQAKQDIIDSIMRLRGRVEYKLRASNAPKKKEPLLFKESELLVFQELDAPAAEVKARFTDPEIRVYAKDLAEHAIKHLPHLIELGTIDEIRKYLTTNLRFNSQSTRRRNANYLINRYFPGEVVHSDVIQFASAAEGKPALGDALFYLTCRTEKIVALVAEEVVFPSLAMGGISRTKIKEFVQSQFPNSKSAVPIGAAVVATYQRFGVASANRTKLNVSLREGCTASFAYVLHLEFPEPGMYSFDKMLNGPMHQWLLWDQTWMVRQLYVLREAGLLSKVSEIDRMCQFTTKFSLKDAVGRIVALPQGGTT